MNARRRGQEVRDSLVLLKANKKGKLIS